MNSIEVSAAGEQNLEVPGRFNVLQRTSESTTVAYIDQMARCFRAGKTSSLLIGQSAVPVGIMRLTCAKGLPARTPWIPYDKAFVVAVHLNQGDARGCEVWLGTQYSRTMDWPLGGSAIYDVESGLALRNAGPVDWVHYYIPRSTLERLADDLKITKFKTLHCPLGVADPVLHRMTEMILPSLDDSARFSQLFLDQYSLLLCTHLMKTYGGGDGPANVYRGGLAPWQRRRAMELLAKHLDGSVRLATLAEECGLSVSHFARSFRKTFGRSAHQFLILQRIEKAKALLSVSMCVLSEAALQSGFADQAAFSRTFKAVVGTSPGQWRRAVSQKRYAALCRRPNPELLLQTATNS